MPDDINKVALSQDIHKTTEMLKIELNKSRPDLTVIQVIVNDLSIRTVTLLGVLMYEESKGVKK